MMFPRWFPLAAVAGMLLVPGCKRPEPVPNPQADTTAVDTAKADTTAIDPTESDTTDPADTIATLSASDTLPAPRGLRRLAPTTLGYGMFNTPRSEWGKYNFTGIVAGVLPRYLGSQLRSWQSYGMSGIVNFPHSQLVNGRGQWDLNKCIALGSAYAQYFPPDSILKYINNGVLVGFNTGDDFTSLSQWNGVTISQAEQAKCIANARAKLGADVPLGVRATMSWIVKYNNWGSGKATFGWVQYRTSKGSLSTYLNDNARLARQYGYKLVAGVNSHNCYKGTDSGPCRASDFRTFATPTITTNADVFCFSPHWRWDDGDWRNSDFRNAVTDMGALAKQQPARSCRA